jgi:hypothetical protein
LAFSSAHFEQLSAPVAAAPALAASPVAASPPQQQQQLQQFQQRHPLANIVHRNQLAESKMKASVLRYVAEFLYPDKETRSAAVERMNFPAVGEKQTKVSWSSMKKS